MSASTMMYQDSLIC